MKRNMIIVLAILIVFVSSACNNTTKQKEVDIIKGDTETFVDSEIIDGIIEEISYDKISAYMEEESRKAFSPYYELLDFQISDYHEKIGDGNTEATFLYKLICKNYDKDPDTVGYIKEAKESGNKNYQQMYDEYLQPREMNFHLKAVIDEDGLINLYSNISPVGVEWEETKMTDFILK